MLKQYTVTYHDNDGYGYTTGDAPIYSIIDKVNIKANNRKEAIIVAKCTKGWQGYRVPLTKAWCCSCAKVSDCQCQQVNKEFEMVTLGA